MSVPSVATSVSPTSASSIFSSQSYSTESIMVTPTQGLVSQQILSIPSSSTIVDMATLNSLNNHSCNGTNLVCRNAQSLPSHDSTFPVDPDPCISKLTTSKIIGFNENSAKNQENVKSSSLENPLHYITNSNCAYDTSKQLTPAYTSKICTENVSVLKAELPKSYLQMSGAISDSEVCCMTDLECSNASTSSAEIQRVRNSSVKNVVNHSCIVLENEKIPSSLNLPLKLTYSKEDQNDNTLTYHCCNENVQDVMLKASHNVCSCCSCDNSIVLNGTFKQHYLAGKFNCEVLSENYSCKLSPSLDYSECNSNESTEMEKYRSWNINSSSGMPSQITCLLPQQTKQSHNGYTYSGANILSIPSHLVERHVGILKFGLVVDPKNEISANGFSEYLFPKMLKHSEVAGFSFGNTCFHDRYLCHDSRKLWFQEQLALMLLEVPASSKHSVSLDLSKIMQEICSEKLGFVSRAMFMKKCIDLSSADASKSEVISFIKVVPVKNCFNSTEGSISADASFLYDQLFVKIIPAANVLIKLNSSSSSKVLPIYGIEVEEEGILSDFISCVIVPSENYLPEKELSLLSKGDEQSVFVGLLVPSTKLLRSLNVSICQKDSLGVRLGSSRPIQQYSTHTSVDLQLNGNNVEFIPIIPLGVYSQSESSDPDLKFLSPVAENSFRDVNNIEDIFLINNGSGEEVLNPGMTSMKQLGLADIFSTKSSPFDPETYVKNTKSEDYSFTIPDPPKSISKGNVYSILQRDALLECVGGKRKKLCQDSNGPFHTITMPYEKEIKAEDEECPDEKVSDDLQAQQDIGFENNGLPSLDKVLSKKVSCDWVHEKKNSAVFSPHLSHSKQPFASLGFLPQQYVFSSESKIFSEKLDVAEKGIDSDQNSTSLSSADLSSVISHPKNNFSYDLRTSYKDNLGVENLDSSCYYMKRKTHSKRSEGHLKPFRISKMTRNKQSVDLRKAREMPAEEKIMKMREDVNSKLSSAMKSAANSWKHNPYASNCLSMIKNIISSGAHLNSMQSAAEDSSKNVEENNRGVINKLNYKSESNASINSKLSRFNEFSSRGRGRQASNFKSPDRKFGRNFFLSTTGSVKRSKLTILIFCLAVTSLLISLHALSTDSSLYIKPTFFLVQEDDTSSSSFSSESSYLKKSSLHQSGNEEVGGLMVGGGPIYRSILVKEEIGVVKEEKGADGSVTYIKSRKDTLNWTRSRLDESVEMKSKNDILSEVGLKGSGFKMALGRNDKESKKLYSSARNILNGSSGKSDGRLKPSISKAAFNFLTNANFNSSKTYVTSSIGENTEEMHNTEGRSEILNQHSSVNSVEQHLEGITDSGVGSSSQAVSTGEGGTIVDKEASAQPTMSTKSDKGVGFSSTENLTKLPLADEGTSSNHNDFDLNIAFIEKNELNAAYGIDSGTTGAEGNFEEDYVGEEDMTQMATSGNRVKFPKATRRLPQALIIGVRKGGTRALLEMLHLHPLVQKAAGEAHFFDRDENYAKGLQWYRRRMPPSLKGQITVEKSPSYFVTPEVPERVRAMNASIRLLLIVREPVTRAISDFAQLRSHSLAAKANTTTRSKLEGVDEDYGKKVSRPLSSFESLAILPDGRVDMSWRPISVSLYHRHISAWLEAFPRDQILIVDGDQLASNPAPVLASVEKFLKLRPALTPTHFYFNATKGFYCLRSLPPGQPVDGMAMMPSSLSQSASLPEGKCLRESKGRRHPHVDPSVVHKLRRFFAEHNRRFYEMVGEDFGWPEE